jgi:aromatic-L-amino-acid/L-tryptophan decarboxylase
MTSPAGAAPNQGTPAQATPAQGTGARDTPAQDTGAQETSAPGTPASGTPAAGPPTFWDAAQIRRVSHQVADVVADYLTRLPGQPAYQPPPHGLLEAMRAAEWAEQGEPAEAVLAEFSAHVAPYPFGNGHPGFAAWVNSPPHPLGVLAEALAAAMDPSVAGGNHAAVHLEHQVIRWFASLLGWPGGYSGQLVSGGSAATLTALAVARHRVTARAGTDDRRDGLAGLAGRLVLYTGTESHSCVTKAAEVLGLGSASIQVVPSDQDHRMRPDELERLVQADQAAGKLAVAVVATAGTTNTGAIDPLGQIAGVCARYGVWLHVDGAYGAPPILLLDRYRTVRDGLARADSVAVDAHKWLYVPVDAGLVLLRDGAAARDTFSLVPAYLRTDGDEDGPGGPVWFSEYGLEQTRPFRALKVWMQLRHLGRDGYRRLIAADLATAGELRQAIETSSDFELLAGGLSVVCFRHRPAGMDPPRLDSPGLGRAGLGRAGLGRAGLGRAGLDQAALDHAALDQHNRAVLKAVQLGGRSFLAGTIVDGAFALRACIVNPGLTAARVPGLLRDVRERAAELLGTG